jgi:hypothetical protein
MFTSHRDDGLTRVVLSMDRDQLIALGAKIALTDFKLDSSDSNPVYTGVARLLSRRPYLVELQPVNGYPNHLLNFLVMPKAWKSSGRAQRRLTGW